MYSTALNYYYLIFRAAFHLHPTIYKRSYLSSFSAPFVFRQNIVTCSRYEKRKLNIKIPHYKLPQRKFNGLFCIKVTAIRQKIIKLYGHVAAVYRFKKSSVLSCSKPEAKFLYFDPMVPAHKLHICMYYIILLMYTYIGGTHIYLFICRHIQIHVNVVGYPYVYIYVYLYIAQCVYGRTRAESLAALPCKYIQIVRGQRPVVHIHWLWGPTCCQGT